MTKEQFKKTRLKMGLTQVQFAELLGYEHPLSILRKENGQSSITRQDEIILKLIKTPGTKKV